MPSTVFGKLRTHNAQEVLGTEAHLHARTGRVPRGGHADSALALRQRVLALRQRVLALRQAVASTPNSHAKRSLGGLDLASRALWSKHGRRFGAHETHARSPRGAPSAEQANETGKAGHAITRSKCVAFAPSASLSESMHARGAFASEARTARGRQCFERMNGGIIGGFGSRCQAESFLEVRLSLWNGDSVEVRGVEKNYKKYVDSPSRKGWLTGKRNV